MKIRLKSIQVKVALWTGACLILVAAILIGYAALSLYNRTTEAAEEQALAMARSEAAAIKSEVETGLDAARTLAQGLSVVKSQDTALTRGDVNAMLKQVLIDNPQFLGVYTLWEPNAFDGQDADYAGTPAHDETGRFIPYWVRDDQGVPVVEALSGYEEEGIGDWYLRPRRTKKESILDPFLYPVQGEDVLMTSLVVPIVVDGEFHGITGVDVRVDFLQELADGIDAYDGTAQLALIGNEGTLAGVTGQPDLVGEYGTALYESFEDDLAAIQEGQPIMENRDGHLQVFEPISIGSTETPWSVSLSIPRRKITAAAVSTLWQMIAIGVVLTGGALGAIWVASGRIAQPIRDLTLGAKRLAEGDAEVTGLDAVTRQKIGARSDELGEIGRAFESLMAYLKGKTQAAAEIARGDLSQQVPVASDSDALGQAMVHMKDRIGGMAGSVNGLIKAAVAGKLDTRADAAEFEGEYREIVDGMNQTLDAVIGPLNVTAEYVDRISKGDIPAKITDDYRGDFNEIKNNLNGLIDSLNRVLDQTDEMNQAMAAGRLDVRGDARAFQGRYGRIVEGLNRTLDAVVGPLNVAAEYVDRIAKGEIPEKISDDYAGDFNEIKNNLNACIDGLGGLVEANDVLQRMAVNDYTDKVGADHVGIYADVARGVNTVQERLLHIQETARNISRGDLSDLERYRAIGNGTGKRSENDEIVPAFIAMMESLDGLVKETNALTKAAVAGRLDTRGETSGFRGDFATVVEGVNGTLDAIIAPLNVTAEYVDRISKGDIPEKITDDYAGDFNEIKNNLNGLIDSLNGVLDQTDDMNAAMAQGRLDVRGDARTFQGRYRRIVEGLNGTLDAVVGPLNVAAEYVDRISKGDIPEKITDDYRGDFNEIKNNLNACIDGLGGLVEANAVLQRLAVNDYTEHVQGQYDGIFDEVGGAVNTVRDRLMRLQDTALNIAQGDLSDLELYRQIGDGAGKRSENDQMAPAYISMMEALQGLVHEVERLSEAAVRGDLDVRGDASGFSGEFANVVEGVNATLDAVVDPMQAVSQAMSRVASGDLTVEMNGKYRGDYAKLSESVDAMVVGLRGMAGGMQEGAMNISSATSEILASSSQMASTTKEQASAVTEVTSTVEEIQSSAEQVAQRAQGVAEAAQQAARAARDGSMAADEAIAAMDDIRQRVDAIAENILSLSEQTQQIGEIIDTVTDIADQSNILALNAAIEAAQAGEAGKGFRVVADEVRSLAEQSRQAAAQVKVILGDIQEASNRAVMATEQGTKQVAAGSDQVERTAQTIRELSATVEQSSSASEQIVAGVQQQTVGLDQIAVGMMDINQAAQQAAAGAEQSEKAAQDLDTLGADLGNAVEQYRM